MMDAATTALTLATIKDYLDVVLKPPLKQLGELLSDRVEERRLMNRLKAIGRMRLFMEENGLRPEAVLPDIFLDTVDEAGKSSDDTISDMFASLLVESISPNPEAMPHPSYPQILSQLSSFDAKLLMLIAEADTIRTHMMKAAELPGTVNESFLAFCFARKPDKGLRASVPNSAANLERLGLVKDWRETRAVVGVIDTTLDNRRPTWKVTKFGELFLKAVTRIPTPRVVESTRIRSVLMADGRSQRRRNANPWASPPAAESLDH